MVLKESEQINRKRTLGMGRGKHGGALHVPRRHGLPIIMIMIIIIITLIMIVIMMIVVVLL